MGLRVAVLGAGGRMGATVCETVEQANDLELVARIDGPSGLDDVDVVEEVKPDVAVDFTHASALRHNLETVLRAGCHAVVGTTGWDGDDADHLRAVCEETRSHCLLAPNFAIGAVLMMKAAAMAAPYFERAEVIEFHHDGKRDAPSGTARLTAEMMTAARQEAWPARGDSEEVVERVRGGRVDDIRVHSVRLPGVIANQEVILGTTGQTLTLRHDTTDRTSFMPGVLFAVRHIADHPGLTIGLDHLMDL